MGEEKQIHKLDYELNTLLGLEAELWIIDFQCDDVFCESMAAYLK